MGFYVYIQSFIKSIFLYKDDHVVNCIAVVPCSLELTCNHKLEVESFQ